LALKQSINKTELLLFIEADSVFGELAAHLGAVNPRRITATFECFARTEQEGPKAAADASGRAGITSHGCSE
jgi:hypothetical protein